MKESKNDQVLKLLTEKLEIPLKGKEEKMDTLIEYINFLIDTDFNKLLSILYRIDVSEEKVKTALAKNKTNQITGEILAALLIERESMKLKKPANK